MLRKIPYYVSLAIAALLVVPKMIWPALLWLLNTVGMLSVACTVPNFSEEECGARAMLDALQPFAPVLGLVLIVFFAVKIFREEISIYDKNIKCLNAEVGDLRAAIQSLRGDISDSVDTSAQIDRSIEGIRADVENAHRYAHAANEAIRSSDDLTAGREKQLRGQIKAMSEDIKAMKVEKG